MMKKRRYASDKLLPAHRQIVVPGAQRASSSVSQNFENLKRLTALYRVEFIGRDLFVKTRWCYVYAYYEKALIDSARMVIHFLDSNDDCDIDKFLSK
ncbi:MAG: hypothetical protein BMS9Abin37_0831 [Acidobacteriota bacterium]|nr:MAG: hypothetical protein BMS9Abin37_0831 [Acidobacteriota bacterium]